MNHMDRTYCPSCGRSVAARTGRYSVHGHQPGSDDYCPLSQQPVPARGLSHDAHRRRAGIVCQLAAQLRDEDPALVHHYIGVQSRDELERLLVVALAAIPTDRTLLEVFEWVTELPAARYQTC